MRNKKISTEKNIKYGFAIIAAWQFATFFILFLLVWINEIFDLSAIIYDTPPHRPNYFSATIISAFIILAAIIVVGQTYIKQKQFISGMITVCMNCHKVRINDEVWQSIEKYICERHPVEFSHGYCPECFKKEMKKINTDLKS